MDIGIIKGLRGWILTIRHVPKYPKPLQVWQFSMYVYFQTYVYTHIYVYKLSGDTFVSINGISFRSRIGGFVFLFGLEVFGV